MLHRVCLRQPTNWPQTRCPRFSQNSSKVVSLSQTERKIAALPSQALWQILSRSSDLPVRERSNRRVLAIACCVLRIVGPPPRQGKSGTECRSEERRVGKE